MPAQKPNGEKTPTTTECPANITPDTRTDDATDEAMYVIVNNTTVDAASVMNTANATLPVSLSRESYEADVREELRRSKHRISSYHGEKTGQRVEYELSHRQQRPEMDEQQNVKIELVQNVLKPHFIQQARTHGLHRQMVVTVDFLFPLESPVDRHAFQALNGSLLEQLAHVLERDSPVRLPLKLRLPDDERTRISAENYYGVARVMLTLTFYVLFEALISPESVKDGPIDVAAALERYAGVFQLKAGGDPATKEMMVRIMNRFASHHDEGGDETLNDLQQ